MEKPQVAQGNFLSAKEQRINYLVERCNKQHIGPDRYDNYAIRQLIRKHYALSKVTENDYVNAILARLGDGKQ